MGFWMYQPWEHSGSQGRDDPTDQAAGMIGKPKPPPGPKLALSMPKIVQARTLKPVLD
jgi:hypothetical protein